VRELIVNADDLGRCARINAGIRRAHEDGIVTSASLMVRWPGAQEAVAWARERGTLSLGLHLDLGEWAYGGGAWPAVYEVVALDEPEAVEAEARAQLARFRELVGRDPTHLDSHQHVHRAGPAADVAERLGAELGVPVRGGRGGVRHCGDFYGRTHDDRPLPEAVTPERLAALIAALPEGVTELGCHPGDGAEAADAYDAERRLEVAALCDPHVPATIAREGVVLRPY
jgi:chitin disaccharide deacetylase